MPYSQDVSAGESIAWQIAYSSNRAYDEMQAARSGQAQASPGGPVAERDFEILKTMAHAIASAEDSPFQVDVSGRGSGPTQADRPRQTKPKERRTAGLLANDVLIDMLDNGPVVRDGDLKASHVLQQRVGFDNYDWAKVRPNLSGRNILVFEKDRITINEETVAEMEQEGKLSDEVLDALKRYRAKPRPEAPDPSAQETTELSEQLEEPEEVGEASDIEELEAPAPRRNQRKRNIHKGKIFSFDFESGDGRTFARQLQPGALAKLPQSIKLLLGVGQARDSKYSFYTTEEQRLTFVLKVVNKGILNESDHLDETGMHSLIDEALAKGYLSRDNDGLCLTRLGFDTIIMTKHGRSYLGQIGLRETADLAAE